MKPWISLVLFILLLSGGCVVRQQAAVQAPSKNTTPKEIVVQPAGILVQPVEIVAAPVPALTPAAAVWPLRPGLLRAQLESWAALADYQVVWDVTRDYSIQNDTLFQGSFVDALTKLFTGLQQMGNSFKVTVYQGNRVVLISEE